MKKFYILINCILACTLCFGQHSKINIAVLDLEPKGITTTEAEILSDRLRTEIVLTDQYQVVERDKMFEILTEQDFQKSGCTTVECAVEVGQLLNVTHIVAGNVAKIDNLFTINIRLIDVETGKVLKTAVEDCDCRLKEVLTTSIKNITEQLTGTKSKIGNTIRINPQTKYTSKPENNFKNSYNKSVVFSPHFGMSSSLGQLGVEIQVMNFALDFGVGMMDFSLSDEFFIASGIKYYYDLHKSSWYWGIGAAKINRGDSYTLFGGIMPGYRWMWSKHWNVCTGLGLGYGKTERPKKQAGKPDAWFVSGVFELSLQYIF